MLEHWARFVDTYMTAKGAKATVLDVLKVGLTETGIRRSRPWDVALKQLGEGLETYIKKCRGGGGKVPPRADWNATAWTFTGVFLTLIIMSSLNKFVVTQQ